MLAPLENRSLIEREPAGAERVVQLEAENLALKQALRQARQRQKRSTTLHARKLGEQRSEIARLETLCRQYRKRIDELESGQAIVELGQQLMTLKHANEQLLAAAQRVWYLDKTICAAHRECERLARERDTLARRLCDGASAVPN